MSQQDEWYQFHATTCGYIGTTLCQIPTLKGSVGEYAENNPLDVILVQRLLNQAIDKGYIRQHGIHTPETGRINGQDYTIMLIRQFQLNQGLLKPGPRRIIIHPDDETFKRLLKAVNSNPVFDGGVATGRAFLFVLADEILPSGKLVRKVIPIPPTTVNSYIINHPETFGFSPRNPNAAVSLAEHALGNTNSPYLSASAKPGGAPNFKGQPFYIDVKKAEAAGVRIYSTQEIIADLQRLARQEPHLEPRINQLLKVIDKVEGEVLIKGRVPASAVKTSGMMTATRTLRFVQTVGVVLTVYDLGNASVKSVNTGSVRPIAAESVRQVGGWAGALAGAKIGGMLGAAVGIETGPGALITGGVGALIFGAAGYFGADWIADHIDEN